MGKMENHWNWRGGSYIHATGYVMVKSPTHPRAIKEGYMLEHILVMEKALGRPISRKEMIHHIDENRANNNIGNLILFKTIKMHTRFHIRLKAYQATGHWDWLKCCYCKKHDKPENIFTYPNGSKMYHKICHNADNRVALASPLARKGAPINETGGGATN